MLIFRSNDLWKNHYPLSQLLAAGPLCWHGQHVVYISKWNKTIVQNTVVSFWYCSRKEFLHIYKQTDSNLNLLNKSHETTNNLLWKPFDYLALKIQKATRSSETSDTFMKNINFVSWSSCIYFTRSISLSSKLFLRTNMREKSKCKSIFARCRGKMRPCSSQVKPLFLRKCALSSIHVFFSG